MKKMHMWKALAAVALATPGVFAQANDSCDTPEAISGFGSFVFDTTFATPNAVGIDCGLGDAFSDVWFCWTSDSDQFVTIDTCGGDTFHDTMLAIYEGCFCPGANTELLCNDDTCGVQSSISFFAAAGASYLIRVGGFDEFDVGTGSIRVQSAIIHTAELNGHTYHLYSANTWTRAEEIAIALGGNLVAINDAAENDFVQFSVLGFDGIDRRTWIGFNDAKSEGIFQWSNGDAAKFTNWNPGEPNDFGGNEDYTEMFGGNGQWNDQPDGGNGFVQFGIAEIGGVTCAADFNADDVVNSQDFFDFLAAFFENLPIADFNRDKAVNSQDFFDFLTAFFEGC